LGPSENGEGLPEGLVLSLYVLAMAPGKKVIYAIKRLTVSDMSREKLVGI
jgi:hypothetical protein